MRCAAQHSVLFSLFINLAVLFFVLCSLFSYLSTKELIGEENDWKGCPFCTSGSNEDICCLESLFQCGNKEQCGCFCHSEKSVL